MLLLCAPTCEPMFHTTSKHPPKKAALHGEADVREVLQLRSLPPSDPRKASVAAPLRRGRLTNAKHRYFISV